MSTDEERQKATAGFEPVKKILVIQGSPRGKRGRTEECLEPFLKGVREAGAEAEVVYLHELRINHCLGCFTCWEKTPGVCVQEDDMPALLEKLREAATLLLAAPLYIFSVPGLVKDFLDRSLPLVEPWLVRGPDGQTRHLVRFPQQRRLVILSMCGFPEVSHFGAMLDMFHRLWSTSQSVIVGELLRPASEALPNAGRFGAPVEAIRDGFYEAGKELVEHGYITQASEEKVRTPIFRDNENLYDLANAYWRASRSYHQAKRQGVDLPEFEEYLGRQPNLMLAGMAAAFRPEKGKDLKAIIQFEVTGDEAKWYHLRIKDGLCRCLEGRAPEPDLTIHTPWQVWRDIGEGRLSGQDAAMQGQYKAEGDLSLLMRFNELFGG